MTELPATDKKQDFKRILLNQLRWTEKTAGLNSSACCGIIWIIFEYATGHYRQMMDNAWLICAIIPVAGGLCFLPFFGYREWKDKWKYLENTRRRTYAYKYRTMSSLYSSPAASNEEREERRLFLTKELSILSADMEQFQKAYPINTALNKKEKALVCSPEEIAHVLAEFSDAKELIGRELAALTNRLVENSAQLEFINIDGSAFIEYEGSAVRSIELDIREEGEFIVYLSESDACRPLMTAKGANVTKVLLTQLATSGEILIQPMENRLSERIPLP